MAEAISVDQLKKEQAVRDAEIATLEWQLASNEELLAAPAIIDRMFVRLDNLTEAYLRAAGPVRRSLNQAVFTGFWFGDRQLKRYEFQPAFGDFLEAKPSNSDLMVDQSRRYLNAFAFLMEALKQE